MLAKLRKLIRIRKAKNITETERDTCERYGEHVIGTMLGVNYVSVDLQALGRTEESRNHARDWLTEVADRREGRENIRYWLGLTIEVGVIVLIGIEIALSIYYGNRGIREGREQSKVLAQMQQSTAATADAMNAARDSLKSLADAQAESLKILQQQQAEHAKKPRLALYVGNTPLDRVSIHLQAVPGLAQDTASFDLSLKNQGDAPVSTFRLHAVTPKDTFLDTERLITVPESEPPADPNTLRTTLQLPSLPASETIRIHISIYAKKGLPAFKIPFTLDAFELQAVTRLGSLTVLPPKP